MARPGDYIVFSSIPNCGRCPSCARGRQNLCDNAAAIMGGWQIADGSARHHTAGLPGGGGGTVADGPPGGVGTDLRISCQVGCYARHTVVSEYSVVPVNPYSSVRPETACLVGCGVPTGWGSGAYTIDPVAFKRDKALGFDATHTAESVPAVLDLVRDVTWGRLCDVVVLTMGTGRADLMDDILALVGKGSRVVVTNIYPHADTRPNLYLSGLGQWEEQIRGCIFGSVNSRADIPRLLALSQDGLLDLDGMVTRTYPLKNINAGYQDMLDGKNIRGVLAM